MFVCYKFLNINIFSIDIIKITLLIFTNRLSKIIIYYFYQTFLKKLLKLIRFTEYDQTDYVITAVYYSIFFYVTISFYRVVRYNN